MSDDETYTEDDYQAALADLAGELDSFLTIGLALGKPRHQLFADVTNAVVQAASGVSA